MMSKGQTHVRRNCFSIYIISNKLQIGYYRYLVYTPKFGLWYPKGSTFDLIGYSDVDWAGCKIDRKSTSGTCQF
jgi:hypothetical protein